MKVLVVVLILICASKARLVSQDETETLFKKFVLKELSDEEASTLEELFEIFRRPNYVSPKEERTDYTIPRNAYSRNLECLVCTSGVSALFQGVSAGQSDEELMDSITTLCVSLGIQSENVCKGAVALNLPILTYIIRNTPEATPRTFCSLILQNSQSNDCPHDDTRFEWQVKLPALSEVNLPPVMDQPPLKVAVITDAHIDPLYEAYGVGNCDEPTCCRKGQNPARNIRIQANVDEDLYDRAIVERNDEKMVNLSVACDIRRQMSESSPILARQNADPAGYWGDYRSCDTPIWAFDDVIDRIAETHQDIDLVYYVGDTIDHGVWETSYELIDDMNRHLIEKMRSSFGENVPVIPTIGNHESQPTNQFAPSYVVGEFNTTWLYEALANKWDQYLTAEARATLLKCGEFYLRPRPGLKVIVINNNVAYRYNWWLVYNPLDAKRHLEWLIEELHESELAGEKVHILAHIPPGTHDLTHTWTREYNRIINRFSSTIAAEFNGHEHSDQFKLFYSSSDGSPIHVAWGGGAATAYSNYNLNYKIMVFDSSTYEPLSMQCYTYNVTEANLTPNRRPHWFLLYDFKNSFDLADLSPTSMDNLVNAMSSGGHFLDLYAAFYSKISDTRWPFCNQDCKINYLCDTVITILWDRRKCEEVTNVNAQLLLK
ncbi:sphingomyelin phosphodiesterase [Amyelois transitella]|uniref:sphingomyelin phosphodiesterase n=1 Tax=Amyelois transitella TaxID=680683 RepID=UPI00298F6A40|nr:sphingomyelin phosphodiesterase [Amyelois transitella]